eukprot:421374_1
MMAHVNVTQVVIDLLNDLYCTHQRLFNTNNDTKSLETEFNSKWSNLLQEMNNNEYHSSSLFCVYYHLRLKNWRIGCGTKYGAHFLLYSQQKQNNTNNVNQRIHSQYLLLHNFNANDDLKLHSYIRLCKNIKKTLILTGFANENKLEINQKLILNQEQINSLKLQTLQCNIVQ